MTRDLSFLEADAVWPGEGGWPYADAEDDEVDIVDPAGDFDDDLVSIHASGSHLLDGLRPLEREVVTARFGLDGRPARTWRDLQRELGVGQAELRTALGDGLAKVRTHLG